MRRIAAILFWSTAVCVLVLMYSLVNSSPVRAQRIPPTPTLAWEEKNKQTASDVRPLIGATAAGPTYLQTPSPEPSEEAVFEPGSSLSATPTDTGLGFSAPVESPPAAQEVFEPSFFRENISSPENFNRSLLAGAVNFLLAMILATAFGFFGNLLNNTIESNEAEFAILIAPLKNLSQKVRPLFEGFNFASAGQHRAALGFLAKLVFLLFLHGLVLSYLDPGFDPSLPDAMFLVIALMFSSALMSLIDDITLFFYVKSRGGQAELRLHSGNFVFVLVSTIFSRMFGLAPGILLGSPAGLENVKDNTSPVRQDTLALGVIFLTALLAWVLSPVKTGSDWLNVTLLLIYAAGVQALFFEMMPVGYLRGRNIFRANRVLWFGLFTFAAFLFLHTMLNPNGDFVEAFKSPNMLSLSIMVSSFCAFSTGVWLYFRRKELSLSEVVLTGAPAEPTTSLAEVNVTETGVGDQK